MYTVALERGRRVREILKQKQYAPMAAAIQIGVLLSVTAGLFDSIPIAEVALAEQAIAEALYTESPALCQQIEKGALLTDEDRETLLKMALLDSR